MLLAYHLLGYLNAQELYYIFTVFTTYNLNLLINSHVILSNFTKWLEESDFGDIIVSEFSTQSI